MIVMVLAGDQDGADGQHHDNHQGPPALRAPGTDGMEKEFHGLMRGAILELI
jgi:hypothetical protein